MVDLERIYRKTLEACAPEDIVRAAMEPSMPRNVVAIGKCAGRMVAGVEFDRALCIVPRGYPRPGPSPTTRLRMTRVVEGGHPDIDDDSFAAGDELLRFVDECDDVLFLISGGGSACVEVPLPPFTRDEIATTNRRLVASDLPIGAINMVRKHLSAIKGGRLAARVRGRSVTLVYSDVSAGAIGDVASGPTVADQTTNAGAARILARLGGCEALIAKLESASETIKEIPNGAARIIADNATLTTAAARLVEHPVLLHGQIETSVEEAAGMLAQRASTLRPEEILIAGGEPTVARRGSGKGGRCCELAVRFAMLSDNKALFASSDGVDGSSGIAGICLEGHLLKSRVAERLLENSDSLAAALQTGRAVIIPPTGNNLRDLFLVAGVNR